MKFKETIQVVVILSLITALGLVVAAQVAAELGFCSLKKRLRK